MKIIYQGDLHHTDRTPVNRVDDYRAAQFNKLRQLVNFANQNKAYLMLGGDIFDSPRVSPEVVNTVNSILLETEKPVFAVMGQHDVPYHQVEAIKSSVYSLWASGALINSGETQMIFGNTAITLVHWETIPDPPMKDMYNIFLGHVSVFKGKVPGYWKGEGYTEKSLRGKYPGYDLYLCGDIHSPTVKDNVVVSGPLMRNSIDLKGYKPRCYFIDTESGLIQPLYYEVEENVFNEIDETVAGEMDLTDLIEAMKASGRLKASYKVDCLALAQKDKEVKTMIEEIFNGLD